MKAVLCSADPRAVEWAESVYREYRDAAVRTATYVE
jgi:predicted transcriptional regulator